MKTTFIRRGAVLAVAAALLLPGQVRAQVLLKLGGLPYGNDNVQAYFAADGDTNHQTDPGTLPSWGSAGIGPYVGNAISPVPSPPGAPIYGSQLTPSNSFFGGP